MTIFHQLLAWIIGVINNSFISLTKLPREKKKKRFLILKFYKQDVNLPQGTEDSQLCWFFQAEDHEPEITAVK